ncbi:YeiH family protein [Epilithonimonas hominis]|uniref:YeiH family protein n=1 Tax=Epilithonimonas hominis TaxID=420404 RepID=UPI00289E5445|nr:putative sulfate exporter family transporter [Epilithonimonas hominis]
MKNNPLNNKKRILDRSITTRELIFLLSLVCCLSPFISPPLALLFGIVIAQFIGHPYLHLNHKATHLLLQISVVGLGFGMNLGTALKAGKDGVLFTVFSIFSILILGYILGKVLKINKETSFLISVGTAICGGSAIAAVSPVINAKEKQVSVALGTIFILNSIALILFPIVGHMLHLSQTQFGLWCAIAIQDTSSVVGAASKYGNEALQIATTVKLTRALWIIPIAFFSSVIFKSKNSKIKIPYFIGLFVVAIILNTYVPFFQKIGSYIVYISKTGMTLTLFLIGAGLSIKVLASVGFKPILQGVILWVLLAVPAVLVLLFL